MDKSLKTVYLYGILKTLTGVDSVQLAGGSVYELIDGLSAMFHKELQPSPDRSRVVVKIRDYETEEAIRAPLDEGVEEIHVYPTLLGGGGGNGLLKIIIGVILVAIVAWAIVVTGGGILVGLANLTALGSMMLTTGIGLIVGGLMEAMMPQPKMDMSAANDLESSKYLGSNGNTVKIGTPISLLMGRHKFYGHIISFNVDSKNVAA